MSISKKFVNSFISTAEQLNARKQQRTTNQHIGSVITPPLHRHRGRNHGESERTNAPRTPGNQALTPQPPHQNTMCNGQQGTTHRGSIMILNNNRVTWICPMAPRDTTQDACSIRPLYGTGSAMIRTETTQQSTKTNPKADYKFH